MESAYGRNGMSSMAANEVWQSSEKGEGTSVPRREMRPPPVAFAAAERSTGAVALFEIPFASTVMSSRSKATGVACRWSSR